jgi:aryl-alcohol dehydrogenase-like predicted oxidoreductase
MLSAMEQRSIGALSVSSVGLGCNNFGRKLDEDASASVVHAALDAGINFFDTADVYGYGDHSYSGTGKSEEFLGAALGTRRAEVAIATKFGISMSKTDRTMRGGGAKWVRQACEDSLRRLGTDYIDLYQLHRPDMDSQISETLGALDELVDEGKVRVAGCSNFSAAQLVEADVAATELGSAKFHTVQNEYSLLRREAEHDVLPTCSDLGVAFLPFFPLASGLLTGKYRRGEDAPPGTRLAFWEPREHQALTDDVLDQVEQLSEIANDSGHSILELAFSWLLSRPQVASVIAGATSPEQVRSNVSAASWDLPADVLSRVDADA